MLNNRGARRAEERNNNIINKLKFIFMKNKFLHGAAALALCAGLAGCSEFDQGITPVVETSVNAAAYEAAFIQAFGQPAADQDWGFGGAKATRALTRVAETWSLTNHDDEWITYLYFKKPADGTYTEIKDGSQKLSGKGTTYYIHPDFTGTLTFDNNFEGNVYVDAKLMGYNGGNTNNVNIYILDNASWDLKNGDFGNNIKIYNNGTLTLDDLNNTKITNIYNAGSLTIGNTTHTPSLHSGVSLYSEGDVNIISKQGEIADIQSKCDIHGTMYVSDNLEIKCSNTQYVCGLVLPGTLKMVEGHLQASYINADKITFDGTSVWLLKEGHIKANEFYMPNSASYIHGYIDSYGLVEMGDFYLQNKNFFLKVFSENLYIKVSGRINATNCSTEDGDWNSIEDYLNAGREPEIAERMNKNISGKPVCGDPYGNPGITPDPTPTDEPVKKGRIFCEDLGSVGDFDFNDVVFDAEIIEEGENAGKAKITFLAAGGILYITVAGVNPHDHLGEGMVNTGVTEGEEKYTFITENKYEDIRSIPILVRENQDGYAVDVPLEAPVGGVPQKICVPAGTRWMQEYTSIRSGYTLFNKWVTGEAKREDTFKQTGDNVHTEFLYQKQ